MIEESQRKPDSQRPQLPQATQWAGQAHRERIHPCSEVEMKNRLHQECLATSCQEIGEPRRRRHKEENGLLRRKLNEYSMQQDQESRTVRLLRESSKILTHRAVLAVPTFPTKLLFPPIPKRLAVKPECSEKNMRGNFDC